MCESTGCLPAAIKSAASRCAPVPQSRISSSPLAVVTSTQEVLPPKWFVPGPGVAMDPRVPQKRTLMRERLPLGRHGPRKPAFAQLYLYERGKRAGERAQRVVRARVCGTRLLDEPPGDARQRLRR